LDSDIVSTALLSSPIVVWHALATVDSNVAGNGISEVRTVSEASRGIPVEAKCALTFGGRSVSSLAVGYRGTIDERYDGGLVDDASIDVDEDKNITTCCTVPSVVGVAGTF
jgi:hypothetical protein